MQGGGSSSLRALLWPRVSGLTAVACPQGAFSSPFVTGSEDAFSLRPPRPHPGTAGDSGPSPTTFHFTPEAVKKIRTTSICSTSRSRFLVPLNPRTNIPRSLLQLFFRDFSCFPVQGKIPVLCGPCKPTSVPSAVSSEEYCCWPASRLGHQSRRPAACSGKAQWWQEMGVAQSRRPLGQTGKGD